MPNLPIHDDYIYESCRLAALILIRVIDTALPITEVVTWATILVQPKPSLEANRYQN